MNEIFIKITVCGPSITLTISFLCIELPKASTPIVFLCSFFLFKDCGLASTNFPAIFKMCIFSRSILTITPTFCGLTNKINIKFNFKLIKKIFIHTLIAQGHPIEIVQVNQLQMPYLNIIVNHEAKLQVHAL